MEFGRHKDIVEKIKHELTRRVQEHPLDFISLPVKIAEMTANIRNHQEAIMNLNDRYFIHATYSFHVILHNETISLEINGAFITTNLYNFFINTLLDRLVGKGIRLVGMPWTS